MCYLEPKISLILTIKLYIRIYFIDSIKFLIIRIAQLKVKKITIKKRILVNTSYHWSHAWFEYLLLSNVKNKENLTALVCDGMPYCELEIITLARPTCQSCTASTIQKLKAFNIPYKKISDYVQGDDLRNINEQNTLFDAGSEKNLVQDKIRLGRYARANLMHYVKGGADPEDYPSLFSRIIKSAQIIKKATENLKKEINANYLVTTNGKFIQSGIAIEVFKRDGLDYLSWDAFAQGDKIIAGINSIAHDQKIPRNLIMDSPNLSEDQLLDVAKYFHLQSNSINMPYKLYTKTTPKDVSDLNKLVKTIKYKKIIAFYTNVEWDSTSMGCDLAFQSMRHALEFVCKFVINRPDFALIIRVHPGEVKVPHHIKTKNTINNFLNSDLNIKCKRIKIVDSFENIKSYDIAKKADFNIVYTSTLGLELPLMGIKPIVVADPYYAGFGFTKDIKSEDDLLNCLHSNFDSQLSPNEVDIAKKVGFYAKKVRLFDIKCLKDNSFSSLRYIRDPSSCTISNLGRLLNGEINEFEISS